MNNEATEQPSTGKFPEMGGRDIRRKIGEELRSAREFQHLSIEEVSIATKINARFIKCIEEGDWSFLPPTYVKAFIKSFSKTVDYQSKNMDKYLTENLSDDREYITTEKSYSPEDKSVLYRPGGFFSWTEQHRSTIAIVAITVVFIVMAILYIAVPDRSSRRFLEPISESVPDTTTIKTQKTLIDTTTIPDSVRIQQPVVSKPVSKVENFKLTIFAEDTCYVKITQQDSLLYEQTLWPKNRIAIEPEKPVNMVLGNAPGVRLIVEGDTLTRFPPGRRVYTCRVGAEGFIQ